MNTSASKLRDASGMDQTNGRRGRYTMPVLLLSLAIVGALSGCGLKGPLFLPPEKSAPANP